MSRDRIVLRTPIKFKEETIFFPLYFRNHMTYTKIINDSSYLEIENFDSEFNIEYCDNSPNDCVDFISGLLSDKENIPIDKKEFDDAFILTSIKLNRRKDI